GFLLGTEDDANFGPFAPSGDPVGGKTPSGTGKVHRPVAPLQNVPPAEGSSMHATDARPQIGGFAPHHILPAYPAGHRQIGAYAPSGSPKTEDAPPLQHNTFPHREGAAVHRRPEIGAAQGR